MQDDVNTLRQLKDELLQMKENTNQGHSTGWNARRSLNLMKYSLNRPIMLPRMDDDDEDEEMELVEEAEQILLEATEACENMEADVDMKEEIPEKVDKCEVTAVINAVSQCIQTADDNKEILIPSEVSPILKCPTPSVSPRVTSSSSSKSLRTCSTLTASHGQSQTDRLAASLHHHGLEVIEKNRKSFALGRSSFRFPCTPVQKDVGVQTFSLEKSMEFLCSNCKCKRLEVVEDTHDSSNLQLVPVDGSQLGDKSKQLVPKAVEKVLAGAIRREMALEALCSRQNNEIMQLNRLVQQYKHERECSLIIGQLQEDKIAHLENLIVNEELTSLANENEILKEKYENHPEILRNKIELQHLQCYVVDSTPKLSKKQSPPVLQITYHPSETNEALSLSTIPESTVESAEQRFESERIRFNEEESKWISLTEELKSQLEANRLVAEKQKKELETGRKCSEELKEAMQINGNGGSCTDAGTVC